MPHRPVAVMHRGYSISTYLVLAHSANSCFYILFPFIPFYSILFLSSLSHLHSIPHVRPLSRTPLLCSTVTPACSQRCCESFEYRSQTKLTSQRTTPFLNQRFNSGKVSGPVIGLVLCYRHPPITHTQCRSRYHQLMCRHLRERRRKGFGKR